MNIISVAMVTSTCIIADADKEFRELLKLQLKKVDPYLIICAEAEDAQTAGLQIDSIAPEIVFMDASLPPTDGFRALEACTHTKFKLIVLSDGEQHALKALKANAVDYLLKPLRRTDLEVALYKARSGMGRRPVPAASLVGKASAIEARIPIWTGTSYEMIDADSIVYCKANNNYTEILLIDRRKFLLSKTLKFYENLLKDYPFCRIHQSYLVNTVYIKSVERGRKSHITLKDNTRLEIAQARKDKTFRFLGIM